MTFSARDHCRFPDREANDTSAAQIRQTSALMATKLSRSRERIWRASTHSAAGPGKMPAMRLSTVLRFVPPVALMALIYVLSAQPDLSTGLGFWDLVLRKLAHATVFAALTLLWLRAFRPLTARALFAAVTISFLYAITDEYHQTYVSGRHGSPVDVGIDAIGIGAAVLFARSGRFKRASTGS